MGERKQDVYSLIELKLMIPMSLSLSLSACDCSSQFDSNLQWHRLFPVEARLFSFAVLWSEAASLLQEMALAIACLIRTESCNTRYTKTTVRTQVWFMYEFYQQMNILLPLIHGQTWILNAFTFFRCKRMRPNNGKAAVRFIHRMCITTIWSNCQTWLFLLTVCVNSDLVTTFFQNSPAK